jgi:hypothetical protein
MVLAIRSPLKKDVNRSALLRRWTMFSHPQGILSFQIIKKRTKKHPLMQMNTMIFVCCSVITDPIGNRFKHF